MTVALEPDAVVVSLRLGDGGADRTLAWSAVGAGLLGQAVPWRTFRWYKGQRHYSGSFWSSTVQDFVVYESRLELSRLLYADFDPGVRHIVAQPFLLEATVDGVRRRHVPDYLLLTDDGPLVVDVKPQRQTAKPQVASILAWSAAVVRRRGWRYEVWSEPPPDELANVRFLAGYRRDWLFNPDLLDALRAVDLGGMRLGMAFRMLPDWPAPLVRSALLHLLWRRYVVTDLSRPLSGAHVLRRAER